ncbi:MAG: tetratricopeptide repeat protein [Pseudomonadota bacterium]
MRAFLPFIALLGIAYPAMAAPLNYEICIDQATIDPERAAAEARKWWEETGDLAARHCEVVALAELGALKTAAMLLDEIIISPDIKNEQRASLYAQLSTLWKDYGDATAARAAIDAAIKITPEPEFLMDRAALSAARGEWTAALNDLNRAVSRAPRNEEALTLRASAKRQLGDLDGANIDALAAIEIRPVSAAAWFELGMVQAALGQKDGARRSWLKAIDLAPGGPSAALARGALQDMDGN